MCVREKERERETEKERERERERDSFRRNPLLERPAENVQAEILKLERLTHLVHSSHFPPFFKCLKLSNWGFELFLVFSLIVF